MRMSPETPTATTALDVPLGTAFPVDSNEPLTVLAKHHVLHDKRDVFMKWTQEMNQLVHRFEGFVNFEIIRPTTAELEHSTGVDEYIAIVRFDNYKNLNVWIKSPERHMIMERTKEYSTEQPEYSLHSLEHWFMTPDDVPHGMAAPSRWKMYVVAVMVSYSQTVWVPKVTGRIFPNARKDHLYGFQFLNVLIVVTMATFVLFPVATRVLSFWLMPGVNYKAKLLQLLPCVGQKTETRSKR
jgi:antibiotic biosynthesis monooxygenase (ABM) superfamily enzyme